MRSRQGVEESSGAHGVDCCRPLQQVEWFPEDQEETVDYNPSYNEGVIQTKDQAFFAPSLAEENSGTLPGQGANLTTSSTTGPEFSVSHSE